MPRLKETTIALEKIGELEKTGEVKQDTIDNLTERAANLQKNDREAFAALLVDASNAAYEETYNHQLDVEFNSIDLDSANLAVIDQIAPNLSTVAKDQEEFGERSRPKFADKHYDRAMNSPSMVTYFNSLTSLDQNTKDFIIGKQNEFITKQVNKIQGDLSRGVLTYEQSKAKVAAIRNVDVKNACLAALENSPQGKNFAQEKKRKELAGQRKDISNNDNILDNEGKVDLDTLEEGVTGSEAYDEKDVLDKGDIKGGIDSAKKERERLYGNGESNPGLLAKMEQRRALELSSATSEINMKKFKENWKYIKKGLAIGLPLGLLLIGGLQVGGVMQFSGWALAVGALGGAAVGGSTAYGLSEAFNPALKKLDVKQLDAEIKNLEDQGKIDKLILNARKNDRKAIEEIFNLAGLVA